MEINGFFGVVYRFSEWITRFVYVTLLWLLFTVLGFGLLGLMPATTAMFSIMRKWTMGDKDIPIFKIYKNAYKSDFRKANVLGLILLLGGGLIYFDFNFFNIDHSYVVQLMRGVDLIASIIYLMMLVYVFPVFVHYDTSVLKTLKYATLFALGHPFRTMGLLIPFVWLASTLRGILPLSGLSLVCYVLMHSAYQLFRQVEYSNELK